MALSPRQNAARDEFLANKTEWLETHGNEPVLKVLLWGPSAASPLKDKMDQIEKEITQEEHLPILSKDVDTDKFGISLEEFADAANADVILILAGSFGPVAELHQFAFVSEVARKMFVFLPEEADGSFTDEAIRKQLFEIHCMAYTDSDLDSCSAKSMAMEIIKGKSDSLAVSLAMAKYMSERRK